jgi:hypothetical protein
MRKKNRQLEPLNPFVEAVIHDMGLPPDNMPRLMTHEQVLESRRQLLASRPQTVAVAPPHVPDKFLAVRFGNTEKRQDVKGYPAAMRAVHRWVEDIAAGRHYMLALVGETGTSKSHLASCAAWALYEEHNLHTPFYSWYDLVDWLRYGRVDMTEHGAREVPAPHIRQTWHDTRYCIVDEVRPTSGTDFDAVEMTKFSLQRYDRNRSVLLTCNWSSLGDMIGKHAADRYTVVTLDGPSYRKG